MMLMEKDFDYGKAVAELEELVKKVEDPETKLDDMDALVKRSRILAESCREYLRTVRENIDSIEQQ